MLPLSSQALNAEFAKDDIIPNTSSQDCDAISDCDECASVKRIRSEAYIYTETDDEKAVQSEATAKQERRLEDRKTQDFDSSDSVDSEQSDSEFEQWRWRDYD